MVKPPEGVVHAYRNMGASALALGAAAARCCDRPWNLRRSLSCQPPIGPAAVMRPPPPANARAGVGRASAADSPALTGTRGSIRAARGPGRLWQTTLLSEWAASDGRRFVWIDLAVGDNDFDRLIASARRTVHDTQAPTVLVVDNAHLVSTPETFDALHEVARSMPAGSQLALASRSEPGLPGSLRAHRRIFELRTGDMAMTR